MTYLVAYELPTEHHPSLLFGLGYRVYWLAFLQYITQQQCFELLFLRKKTKNTTSGVETASGYISDTAACGYIPDTAAVGYIPDTAGEYT